jgi:N-acetylneuraminate synthase
MTTVNLGNRLVGDANPCMVISEIGINHNGDMRLCKDLIEASTKAGCEVVKFQKRTVETVFSPEDLARPRESPFGDTNGDLKRGLELSVEDYQAIDEFCRTLGVMWTASCWDEGAVDVLEPFEPPFYKIASASLTDDGLLRRHRATGRPLVLSTGMSTMAEIDHAVEVLGPQDLVLLHCTSTYPSSADELNLRVIQTLRDRFGIPVGYSGHEQELSTTVAAVVLGACVVERHVTLDRGMWGSDQPASLEPDELARLVTDIRGVERAVGDGIKRVYDSELPIKDKLRRKG